MVKLDTFSGQLQYSITRHKRTSADTELLTKDAFTYSPQDRLLTQTHQINGGTIEVIANNTYDELGQLISKKVGNTIAAPTQKVDYTYNIRGWLTGINDVAALTKSGDPKDLFAFKINYNTTLSGIANVKALYNGNISETQWATNSDNGVVRTYGYKYDNLNRLKEAVYKKGALLNNYNESIAYDKNGNITNLTRYGSTNDNSQTLIDNLTYSYKDSNTANQLMKVTDAVANNANFINEFKDSASNSVDDYSYDFNGNMTKDNNKNITAITYNHLNLPTKITFATTGNIVYIYNAAGQKVQKIVNEIGKSVVTTDYLGGYQYDNNLLKFFPTAEGYVEPSGSSYKYVYQYKDHLGNLRLNYDKTLVIKEESNFYPFGLKQEGYNTVKSGVENKYKYQGQERQDELSLNWDSFKWRNYDYTIGRFMCVDPLAEKYPYNSTYAFQENKMGMGVELEGLELAQKNPLSGFGNYVKGKYDSAVSSVQTTAAKAVQAVSSAISSLGINQVDGYTVIGNKKGISDTTGFFPEAKGANSSGTIDGDFVSALAEAYAPKLDGNQIMDGANIASSFVEKIGIPAAKMISDNSATNSNSKENKIQIEIPTVTFDVSGNGSKSANLHTKDTVVNKKDSAKVTNEAKNKQQNDIKNFNKKHETNF